MCLSMSQSKERGGFAYVHFHAYPVRFIHPHSELLGWSVCAQVVCSCLTMIHTVNEAHSSLIISGARHAGYTGCYAMMMISQVQQVC